MSTLTQLSEDLLAKVAEVADLTGKVAVGMVDDPKSTNYKDVPLPFAVVRWTSTQNLDATPQRRTSHRTDNYYAVDLHVESGTKTKVHDDIFPLIESVIDAVQDPGQCSSTSSKIQWQYVGAKLGEPYTNKCIMKIYFKVMIVR